jgi:ABC-2 type transport system ATP-binding protein
LLVDAKASLMQKLGRKQLVLQLTSPLSVLPDALDRYGLQLSAEGSELIFTYDTRGERTGITSLLQDLAAAGIRFADLRTSQSSLEDIFVRLVRGEQ